MPGAKPADGSAHRDDAEPLRKQAEEEIQAGEERYRHLYAAMPAMLHSIDREGRILDVSDYWLEVLGYERSEVIGRKAVEFLTEESRRYAEEVTLPNFWKRGVARDIRYQFVRKDGELINILLSAIAEQDNEGNRYSSLAVLTDITEQKRLEQARQEREERYRHLYNATPAMLYSIDREGRIVNVSDLWLEVLGFDRSEVIGRKSVEFLTEASRRYAEEVALPDFWERGSARDVHYQFVRKDGEIVDVLLSAIAEQDKDGNPYRTLAVLTDITERRRLEDQLQRAREELEGKVERQMLRKNPYALTFRELTVLHLVAAGRSNKEIAAELVVSPQTVNKHVGNILAKMDAASRTEAATRALREGLLD